MTNRYLELLSEYDLRVLAHLNGWLSDPASATDAEQVIASFRNRPMLISEMLETPGLYEQLLAYQPSVTEGVVIEPSELLSFAILVNGWCAQLTRSGFVATRVGGRLFVPYVLDHDMITFAGRPEHRLFLVELLGSFTGRRLASGLLPSSDGLSVSAPGELDPVSIAKLLTHFDPEETVGLYRRLGDVALFRAGMFAEETATRFSSEEDIIDLLGSLPERFQRDDLMPALAASLGQQSNLELYAELGPIWYRLAARRSRWPQITAPLLSIAENFDAASHALRQLSATGAMRERRSLLFPSAV